MPAPSDFHISGSIDLNLTPQLALETGLPITLKASLNTSAHAEAVALVPLHSRQNGHFSLKVTDEAGLKNLADIEFSVTGDSAGSPDEALITVISRFFDAASLMTRPLTSTSRPAN